MIRGHFPGSPLISSMLTQTNDGFATFMSGGLASFLYWIMAIPSDNIKKFDSVFFASIVPESIILVA
jgi:hypothetical protein